jgi:hypothetical protein
MFTMFTQSAIPMRNQRFFPERCCRDSRSGRGAGFLARFRPHLFFRMLKVSIYFFAKFVPATSFYCVEGAVQ